MYQMLPELANWAVQGERWPAVNKTCSGGLPSLGDSSVVYRIMFFTCLLYGICLDYCASCNEFEETVRQMIGCPRQKYYILESDAALRTLYHGLICSVAPNNSLWLNHPSVARALATFAIQHCPSL